MIQADSRVGGHRCSPVHEGCLVIHFSVFSIECSFTFTSYLLYKSVDKISCLAIHISSVLNCTQDPLGCIKRIVHPKIIQDVDEFVSKSEQILWNLALHHLLTNGSSAVNGCRQNESPNNILREKSLHVKLTSQFKWTIIIMNYFPLCFLKTVFWIIVLIILFTSILYYFIHLYIWFIFFLIDLNISS